MIYLDNAATSFPKPSCMTDAMITCLSEYCGNPGRSGHNMSIKTAEKIFDTRQTLADFFHAENPLQFVFCSNTTEALSLAIKGTLQAGDHVITTCMEHNSVLRPLFSNEEIETTIVWSDDCGRISPDQIRVEIKDNTKMIICTHSSNVTGTILPIKEIGQLAYEHNLLFLVDAAQSAGALPIDLKELPVDMMAFAGHKSLLGPQGTGFLYVREGLDLIPLKDGGTGTESKNTKQPHSFPEGYEAGTVNSPGIVGLGESVKYVQSIGVNAIRQWEEYITDILYSELRNMKHITLYGPENAEEKTAIITLNVKGMECEEVAFILNKDHQIAARSGFHCAPYAHKVIGTYSTGAVRLSPGAFTTQDEISKTIDAFNRIGNK